MSLKHSLLAAGIALLLMAPSAATAADVFVLGAASSPISSASAAAGPEATAVASGSGTGLVAGPAPDGVFTPWPPEDYVYSDEYGAWIRFQDSSYHGQYQVRVKVIQTCNSDGTDCSRHIPSDWDRDYWLKRRVLYEANTILENSGGLVKFEFDDPDDLRQFVHDDYLNMDCVPNPALVPETITDPGFDPDLICDRTSVVAARNALALQYPGRMVVFPRRVKTAPVYDASAGHWTIGYSTDGYKQDHYVAADIESGNDGDGNLSDSRGKVFAHESGHYLGLPHTFDEEPGSIAAVAAMMEGHVAGHGYEDLSNPYLVTRIFDGDNLVDPDYPVPPILDTLPDPGRPVYRDTFGSSCGGSILVVPMAYEVGGETYGQTIFFNPDQQNIMSYFFCGGFDDLHYTPDQVARMQYEITAGSQSHLTQHVGERSSCYGRGVRDDDGAGPSDAAELAWQLDRLLDCLKLLDPTSDLFPFGTVRQLEFELALARLELPARAPTTRRHGHAARVRGEATALAGARRTVSGLEAYWAGRSSDVALDLEDAAPVGLEPATGAARIPSARSVVSTR